MGGFREVRGGRSRVVRSVGALLTWLSLVAGAPPARPAPAEAQERPEAPTEVEILESARQGATHVVKRGDTLWDLAGFYLSNPFSWPRIYEINTSVVENPHWIYPGEVLALPDAVAVAGRARAQPGEGGEAWDPATRREAGPRTDLTQGVSWFGGASIFDKSPEARNVLGGLDVDTYSEPGLVSANDFYRSPMLVDRAEFGAYGVTVEKIEGNPLNMRLPPSARLRDIVIIELHGLLLVPGDRLRAIRWQPGVDGLHMARSLAMLEVLEADDETARAVVTALYSNYSVGDPVIVAESYDVPATLAQSIDEDGMRVELIGMEIEQALLGENDMVFINAGAEDGVRIGDEFAFYPRTARAEPKWEDRLATVRVVRVEARTATARLVDLRDTSPVKGSPGRRVLRAVQN